MAYENHFSKITLEAAADLSAHQYKYVKVDSNGRAAAIAAATDLPVGVLQNKPAALGQAAEILVDGVTKLQADAALTPGTAIGPSADGQADAKTVGTDITEHANGIVLEGAAAAGNYCTALVHCGIPNRAA
jgi:hypothetical protein